MKPAAFLIFASTVLGIYFAINWYVLARLFVFAGLRRGLPFYLLAMFMTSSVIFSIALRSHYTGMVAGAIYQTFISWFGICFIMLWVLLIAQLGGFLFKIPLKYESLAAISLSIVLIAYASYNARRLTVNHITIPSATNLRIVQITDIHIGSVPLSYVRQIVDKTNSLNPDAVLITGDVFDAATSPARAGAKLLAQINAPVYFTSGNHETYVGYDKVAKLLSGTKIKWLRNEIIDLGNWRLIGVDNGYSTKLLATVLETLPPSTKLTVLMNHQPRGFDLAASSDVNLTLSGHTHYGQIFPFTIFVKLFYPHVGGLYENQGSHLYVSSGTGIWGPRLRLGSSNEIVLLDLKSSGN